ncbi:glutathione S-transferase family protein [Asticcacaulis sp. AC402]|uniref:glutathione S-transferase family protein n=1 Tax=Asticcacaulis sp. AC402 TaxID=1282361 RepID=UPI0003C3C5D3|nr:glutathione S-transferase family protein [Asticcacaulis sp. AC402]ESQ74763.1 glutathione S-transferase [Asticcacaulis sp. AC402]
MKLYTTDYAPNPRRVRWVMAEKGITDIGLVQIDIMNLEHRTHPVVAKTGSSHLPVLELDDGSVIAESVAIGRYLESLYPQPNLFGHDAREIADIEMWTRRLEQRLATPLMLGTRLKAAPLAVLETPNTAVADYMFEGAAVFCAGLDAHLAGRDFIAADRLTIADIVCACAFDFARIARFRPDNSLQDLERWLGAMRDRAKTLEI